MLRDDLLHLPTQLGHLVISIDVSKQFHEAKPVVRCEGPVVTRVERSTNLINKIPEHGHQCSQAFGVNNVANEANPDLPRGTLWYGAMQPVLSSRSGDRGYPPGGGMPSTDLRIR